MNRPALEKNSRFGLKRAAALACGLALAAGLSAAVAAATEKPWKGGLVFVFLCLLTTIVAALEWHWARAEDRRQLERKEAEVSRLREQMEEWQRDSGFSHTKSSALAVLETRVQQVAEEVAQVRKRVDQRGQG